MGPPEEYRPYTVLGCVLVVWNWRQDWHGGLDKCHARSRSFACLLLPTATSCLVAVANDKDVSYLFGGGAIVPGCLSPNEASVRLLMPASCSSGSARDYRTCFRDAHDLVFLFLDPIIRYIFKLRKRLGLVIVGTTYRSWGKRRVC